MFISQDKAKWVGGWSILTYSGFSLAFIWVTGAPQKMQVGTICPTKNLRCACGRGEGLCPAGSTVTRQALWLLPFMWTSGDCPPTLVCPKHGLTVLLPQMKGSQALDFLLTRQTAHMGGGLYPHLPQIPYCSPQATKPASQLMNTLWYLPNSGSPYSSRTSSVPHSTHLHRSSVSIAFSAVAQCESATAHHVPTAICPVPFRFQAGLLVPVYEEDKVTICHTPEHRHLSWVTQLFRHAMSVRSVLDAWERHSK